MEIITECEAPRTKIWLLLFGRRKYDEYWEIPSHYVRKIGEDYFYNLFFNDGLKDESWRIEKKIIINIDWTVHDFQNIPERILVDELITIKRFFPILPKIQNDCISRCPKFLQFLRSVYYTPVVNLWLES